jgi:hypothetical protein
VTSRSKVTNKLLGIFFFFFFLKKKRQEQEQEEASADREKCEAGSIKLKKILKIKKHTISILIKETESFMKLSNLFFMQDISHTCLVFCDLWVSTTSALHS